jgi:hypothetical protein
MDLMVNFIGIELILELLLYYEFRSHFADEIGTADYNVSFDCFYKQVWLFSTKLTGCSIPF